MEIGKSKYIIIHTYLMQSLLKYNTFGIEHSCKKIYEPRSVGELQEMLPELRKEPLLIVGGGSNLLLTRDYEGNVLHPMIKGVERYSLWQNPDDKGCTMRAGAGEVWDDVVQRSLLWGCYGMENLSLIPGEVGASAVQNIGAYGVEAKDLIYLIEAVEIATGEIVKIAPQECNYGYRYSRFKDEWKGKYVITHVIYKLSEGYNYKPRTDYGNLKSVLSERGIKYPTARNVREAIIDIRNAKLPDPEVEGNAGSFYMNPVVCREKAERLLSEYPNMPHYVIDETKVKVPAGWLIEQCGWKGKTLGRAGVHDKQALVLVNKGGATGMEIVALSDAIRKTVREKFDIELKPEVNII